ncbi:protein-L-isoaspartate O-methyltransferase family protein [Polycladidibacter hongkongensis]|uniref:protein-L-isoaspartate O-methyltransferase family protein n=1 Tax=Polycladidibacter hongkongensis TaxID=1647556 RepID=UPI0008324302|nr:rRNA adenine N-6-methyltransferase family protein [Pseudovibrio hongkongensis]
MLEAVEQQEMARRAAFMMALRAKNAANHRVLQALEAVPREMFLQAKCQGNAFADRMQPIDCGQMGLAPSLIARHLTILEIKEDHRILEVGTGSGYQAAVISHLCGYLTSVERYRTLVELASRRLASLKRRNVEVVLGDGLMVDSAWEDEGVVYDRIILNGCISEVPNFLLNKLAAGGQLLVPVRGAGERGLSQVLLISGSGRAQERQELGFAPYLPLVGGTAKKM